MSLILMTSMCKVFLHHHTMIPYNYHIISYNFDSYTKHIYTNIYIEIIALIIWVIPYPLISINEETNSERGTIKGSVQKAQEKDHEVQYEATFELPAEFGNVGAVLVENEHSNEVFLKNIVLDGFPDGPVNLTCNSWIQPKHNTPIKRAFFANKVSIYHIKKYHVKLFLVQF